MSVRILYIVLSIVLLLEEAVVNCIKIKSDPGGKVMNMTRDLINNTTLVHQDRHNQSTNQKPAQANKTTNNFIPVKKMLHESEEYGFDLFSSFFTKKSEKEKGKHLTALLYTDVVKLTKSIAKDFPEIAKTRSIGKSF